MNNILLKDKHWQLFLLFLASYFIDTFLQLDPTVSGCIYLALLVTYTGYYAMLGNALFPYLPRKAYFNITWFLIDALLVIMAYAVVLILFGGSFEGNGLEALILGFYLFFAIGHLYWFPAAVLVSIENGHEPVFSQYAGTMLQLFFWPVGIWFIQPRLNRIYKAIQADTLAYPCH